MHARTQILTFMNVCLYIYIYKEINKKLDFKLIFLACK
jgi:hypothetical protein